MEKFMERTSSGQLARLIYHKWMSSMKYALELEEFSYREQGRDDSRYKTFKKHLMANNYDNMRALFQELVELGIIEPTDYPEDVKDGYKETVSGGSGFVNTQDFEEWLDSDAE
jgi:hypothetical protein